MLCWCQNLGNLHKSQKDKTTEHLTQATSKQYDHDYLLQTISMSRSGPSIRVRNIGSLHQ